jgi:hypothetical protein
MDSLDLDFEFKIDISDKTQLTSMNKPEEKFNKLISDSNSVKESETDSKIKKTESTAIVNLKETEDKNKKAESLTSIVGNAIKASKIKEYITLKAEEIVSSTSCIKKLKVEGRVGKEYESELNELQNIIYKNLAVKLGPYFRKEDFWLVECGIRVGDKFKKLQALDSDSKTIDIAHEPGTVLVIDFWSYWSDINSYLNHRVETLKKIDEGKIQGLSLTNIRNASISGEENLKIWNQITNQELLKKYIPQYRSVQIYQEVGIVKVPSIIIVNKEGIISYVGTYKEINFEKSLQNLLEDKSIVLTNAEDNMNCDNNLNSWWSEMDNESKLDIVRDINITLRQMGCCFSSFIVVTNTEHIDGSVKNVTFPMFVGTMSMIEYEIAQQFAIELQNSWNFNNFKFNVKIMNY